MDVADGEDPWAAGLQEEWRISVELDEVVVHNIATRQQNRRGRSPADPSHSVCGEAPMRRTARAAVSRTLADRVSAIVTISAHARRRLDDLACLPTSIESLRST